jgi:hypothetical protein
MPSRRSEATNAIWTRKTCAGERFVTDFIIIHRGCVLNVEQVSPKAHLPRGPRALTSCYSIGRAERMEIEAKMEGVIQHKYAVRDAGDLGRTTFLIVSDHGQSGVHHSADPNPNYYGGRHPALRGNSFG